MKILNFLRRFYPFLLTTFLPPLIETIRNPPKKLTEWGPVLLALAIGALLGGYFQALLDSFKGARDDLGTKTKEFLEQDLPKRIADEIAAHIPAAALTSILAQKEIPDLFKRVVREEKERLERGIAGLANRTWPISSKRLYDAILDMAQHAKKIDILDQDIRRWYEICRSDSSPTSCTFNYSLNIIVATERAYRESAARIRRIFVVNSELSPGLGEWLSAALENQVSLGSPTSPPSRPKYREMSEADQVIVLNWALERHFKVKSADGRKWETVVMIPGKGKCKGIGTHTALKEHGDIVLYDEKICLYEGLDYSDQRDRINANGTKSRIFLGEEDVKKKILHFEDCWGRSYGVHNFGEEMEEFLDSFILSSDFKEFLEELETVK